MLVVVELSFHLAVDDAVPHIKNISTHVEEQHALRTC